ncbi:MAG TPA: c-type cytochrome [Solirubrobacteraceae bacterium]|nr:c-type cytochrome [Solirubrobacteraceae bacterium]
MPSAVLLAGCGGGQDSLQPHSTQSNQIRWLWWGMLIVAGIVFFGAVGMLALAWLRKGDKGLPALGPREGLTNGLVVVFGIVVPVVVLVALFIVANLVVIKTTQAPAKGSTQMSIDVTGKQWFWVVSYDGTPAVTANEIHIPVRTRVRINVRSGDVIHSFWVPELNRKIDTINGQTNSELLYASRPGRYRGQCAEFCGLQHAHMGMVVVAEPMARFRAWLANMAKPAPAPAGGAAAQGQRLFMANQCASCHQIRGTQAQGQIGPDLTHLASRSTLAALTIANTPRELAAWIANPQAIKPGNKMPDLGLSRSQIAAIVSYLEGLK